MQEPDPAFVEQFRAAKRMVERLREQQAADGPRVRSPAGWRVLDDLNPGGRDPSVGWIPSNADALALTWELPLWRRVWARLPFWWCERSSRVWMWYHGYYSVRPTEVLPESGPPPEDDAGVREPRRPIAPASAGAVALELEPEDDIES
jgi:hypothetical protein